MSQDQGRPATVPLLKTFAPLEGMKRRTARVTRKPVRTMDLARFFKKAIDSRSYYASPQSGDAGPAAPGTRRARSTRRYLSIDSEPDVMITDQTAATGVRVAGDPGRGNADD